ncbi:MAG: hybrid sensor histidine kinase/response regulator [Gemmatimonadaceae bacterium]
MHGTHDTPLVALSILIAICASYTALTLAGRVAVARGKARVAWLLGGCVAMGSGIWSMHFVAMLAFHLPVPISYDVPPVALSHFAAVAASAFALWVASRSKVGTIRLCAAGFCLGLAVVAMHYTGMAAVYVQARLSYDPLLVAASVVIAVGASTVALWLFLWLRNDTTRRGRSFRAGAAVVMGLAIAGMHYTAMAAARFTEVGTYVPAERSFLLGTSGLAVPVVLGAFVILALTLLGSITDHWLRAKLAAAEALRESEERYRSVLGEIDEVIFRTDVSGRLTFLNPAWTQITGYSPEASLGTLLLDSVHGDDRELTVAQCQLLVSGEVDFCRHEVRYLTTDGGWRWVEVHARATRGAGGEMAGTAGVIRDVTERRHSEEALRTAREVAEAASRAKSEFLSRMSHELRTPLNAILGFGQLMELDATSAHQRENADHILKAGRHLLHLINEVLDITGIESGHLRLSAEPVSVTETVGEVFDLVGPLSSVCGITLTVDGSAGGRFVHADRQRLKQVLLNIVANAVKYNRQGGSVVVSCEDSDDSRVRIAIADTGGGIAPEKVARLFTPFERLGAEQTGIEGTGLGLALSKRLAEAMNGTIGLQTQTDSGSTFWVELPRATNPLSALDTSQIDVAVTGRAKSSAARRYTILYVEDNLSNLTLVQRIMARRNDIALIPAMQGGLALELARSHRPHLVLLDLHLPDMQGEEVLRQLRSAPDCRDIPVVILTADATPGQRDRLLTAGARAFITKPLQVTPFIEILEDVLEGRAVA